jgi:hypothetical protein
LRRQVKLIKSLRPADRTGTHYYIAREMRHAAGGNAYKIYHFYKNSVHSKYKKVLDFFIDSSKFENAAILEIVAKEKENFRC